MSLQTKIDWIHETINHITLVHLENGDETEVIMVSIDVYKALLEHTAAVMRGDMHMPIGLQRLQFWTVAGYVEIKVDFSWPEDCIQGKTKDEYDADRFFDKLLSN
jgi:hypothetical protein